MLEEFKKFAMRGSVVDLAVGVIIGVAFGAIVTSFVSDIVMPIIGAVTGGLDFSNYYLPLSSTVQQGAAYADAKKQGGGYRLWSIPDGRPQLPDRCLGVVSGDPGHEPSQAPGRRNGGRTESAGGSRRREAPGRDQGPSGSQPHRPWRCTMRKSPARSWGLKTKAPARD